MNVIQYNQKVLTNQPKTVARICLINNALHAKKEPKIIQIGTPPPLNVQFPNNSN